MSKIFSNSVLLRLALIVIIFSSCKKDEVVEPTVDPTPQEVALENLTSKGGKWNPSAVTNWVMVEGVNVAELFKDFTITFTKTGYTTTGTSPVWPRTDTWKFKDNNTATSFIRTSDGKEVTIEVTETTLKIIVTWDNPTYSGRTNSIKGRHEFSLVKPG